VQATIRLESQMTCDFGRTEGKASLVRLKPDTTTDRYDGSEIYDGSRFTTESDFD